jgi:hypothetical protein
MNGRLQRKTANQIVLSEAFRIIRPRRTLRGFIFLLAKQSNVLSYFFRAKKVSKNAIIKEGSTPMSD